MRAAMRLAWRAAPAAGISSAGIGGRAARRLAAHPPPPPPPCAQGRGAQHGRCFASQRRQQGDGAGGDDGASTSAPSAAAAPPLPPAGGPPITSAANAYVKHCVRLRESRAYRQEARRVLVAGTIPLREIAGPGPGAAVDALVAFVPEGGRCPPLVRAARVVPASEAVLRRLTGLESVAGVEVVAELAMPPAADFLGAAAAAAGAAGGGGAAPRLTRLLALEGVQDPGNLGTLLRSALAFGWQGVFLLPGCVDPFNDKALRAARGAPFRLPLAAGGWDELAALAAAAGLRLVAAEPPREGGAAPAAAPAPPPAAVGGGGRGVCLVLGSEGQGLSARALAACAHVGVPMAPGAMESLNVGVAGAILMLALSDGLLPPLLGQLAALGVDEQQPSGR